MGRSFNSAALLALLFMGTLLGCSETELPTLVARIKHPDLVLVTIDTLRADRAADRTLMPALGAFADAGTRFDRAFATAPITTASLGSMLTGRVPREHGALNNTDDVWPELPTVAQLLNAAGYETAAVLPSFLADKPNFERGFDTYQFAALDEPIWTGEEVVARALALLERREAARTAGERVDPLFLWVHLIDPHSPYDAGPEWEAPFLAPLGLTSAEVPPRLRKESGHPTDTRTPAEQAIVRALYDADVRRTDAALEPLLAFLAAPLAGGVAFPCEDRITILTADHGESLGEADGYVGHTATLGDEVLHVPLVLVHAGGMVEQGVGAMRTEPVGGTQVAATLLALAHVAPVGDVPALLKPAEPPTWLVSETFAPEGFHDQRLLRVGAATLWLDARGTERVNADAEDAELLRELDREWTQSFGALGAAKANRLSLSDALRSALNELGYTGGD